MSWKFEEFDKAFNRKKFECGEPALNDYLKTRISKDVERKANQPVFAINVKNEVVGYYTLSATSVEFNSFPATLKGKIAPYPVSVALIGRLAVDISMQGQGLGKELLMHAIDRVEDIGAKIGIRAVVVDAKNDSAEKFYHKYGFELLVTTTTYPKRMFIII